MKYLSVLLGVISVLYCFMCGCSSDISLPSEKPQQRFDGGTTLDKALPESAPEQEENQQETIQETPSEERVPEKEKNPCPKGCSWNQVFTGSGDENILSMAQDKAGDIYITGFFQQSFKIGSHTLTSQGGSDIFIAKLNRQGKPIWVQTAGGRNSLYEYSDIPSKIVIDDKGMLYISGWFREVIKFGSIELKAQTAEASSGFVAKLDSNGRFLWAMAIRSDKGTSVRGMGFEQGKGVVISGYFSGTNTIGSQTLKSKGQNDIYIANINSEGKLQWMKQIEGTSQEIVHSFQVDKKGNIYITGFGSLSGIKMDQISLGSGSFIIKLDNTGKLVWKNHFMGINTFTPPDLIGGSLSIAKDGSVYFTGKFSKTVRFGTKKQITYTSTYAKGFVIKYTPAGLLDWIVVMKGKNSSGAIKGSVIGSDGYLYVSGDFRGAPTLGDTPLTIEAKAACFVAKLNTQGKVLSLTRPADFYENPDPSRLYAGAILFHPKYGITASYQFYGALQSGKQKYRSSGKQDILLWQAPVPGKN